MNQPIPTPSTNPTSGCVVQCRSHRWLVEELEPAEHPEGDTVVRMPRVILFIADDVGLGKTIEAGLILRELLRLKLQRVVVVAEWDPGDPNRRLRRLSEEKSRRALEDLELSLQQRLEASQAITTSLRANLAADVAQVREALDRVVAQRREEACQKLGKRAEEDAARFCKVLEGQRTRVIATELEREPERIRRTFALQTHRLEPAGAIYLWPQGVPAS